MKVSYPYDERRDPPAPILRILVGRPGVRPAVALQALVDSGADVTLLPERIPKELQLDPAGTIKIRGIGGAATVATYSVEIDVAGKRKIVEVVGSGELILVGRDLLNEWIVTLRGPTRTLVVEA